MNINSYVAIGDSFTEGVGDFQENYPNGVRGWADLVAEFIAKQNPSFKYSNLAVRGYLMDQILEKEIPKALEMKPDLVTFCAGGNNLIRPKTNLVDLVEKSEEVIKSFLAIDSKIIIWTAADAPDRPVFRYLRGRFAIFNEILREMLEKYPNVIVADYWRMHEYSNTNLWDPDRLHMSTLGHKVMAGKVLKLLNLENEFSVMDIPPEPEISAKELKKQDLKWYKEFLVPWINRRIRGKSSGDNIFPKYPELAEVKFFSN